MGGLSGKATIVEAQRKTSDSPVLLVDAGKSLFTGKTHNNQQAQLAKAQDIAKAYMLMGYNAVAISAADVNAGSLFLDQTLKKGFPWLSANLVDKNGTPVAPSHLIKTVHSLKIGIIGLTDDITPSNNYSLIDYQPALKNLLKELESESDMIVLLSNFSGDTNRRIATESPGIDIIISSDGSLGKMAPELVGQTLITQTSSRGKYLGKLEIEWNAGNSWYNERLLPLSELIKRETALASELERLNKLEGEQKNISSKKISRLQLQKKRLEKEITSRSALEAERGHNPYNKHRLGFMPVLPTNSPERIEAIVQKIEKEQKEHAVVRQ